MKQRVIRCVYAALLLLNGGISRADEAVVAKDKRKAVDLRTYVRLLSEHLGLGVSFEGQRAVGEPVVGAALLSERTYLFDAEAVNRNGTNVIRLIEAAHPELTGSVDPKTGMLNMFPKTNALCDWVIEQPVDTVASLWQVFLERDTLGLKEHGVRALTDVRGNLEWLHRPIALKLEAGTPVRHALNQICAQMPPGFAWICQGRHVGGKASLNLYRFMLKDDQTMQSVDTAFRQWLKDGEALKSQAASHNPVESEGDGRGAVALATGARSDYSMRTYIRLLCAHLRCRVTFEDGRASDAAAGATVPSKRTYPFDTVAINGNATNAIRLLEAAHPDLTGSVDPDTGMLNLYPRTQALCDWVIERPVDRVASLWQIFKEADVLGLDANGIVALAAVKSDREWMHRRLALKLDANTPVRQALNRIFAQMPIGFSWVCEKPATGEKGHFAVYRFLPADNVAVKDVDADYLRWLKEGASLNSQE